MVSLEKEKKRTSQKIQYLASGRMATNTFYLPNPYPPPSPYLFTLHRFPSLLLYLQLNHEKSKRQKNQSETRTDPWTTGSGWRLLSWFAWKQKWKQLNYAWADVNYKGVKYRYFRGLSVLILVLFSCQSRTSTTIWDKRQVRIEFYKSRKIPKRISISVFLVFFFPRLFSPLRILVERKNETVLKVCSACFHGHELGYRPVHAQLPNKHVSIKLKKSPSPP